MSAPTEQEHRVADATHPRHRAEVRRRAGRPASDGMPTGMRGPHPLDGEGDHRGPARGAARRRQGAAHGRGHRPARRRVPRDRGPAGRVRRQARARHAARRVRHRRHRDRLAMRGYRPSSRSSSTASSSRRSTRSPPSSPARRCATTARSMPVVIRVPYGGHIGSIEHHQESPEAYFAHTRACAW